MTSLRAFLIRPDKSIEALTALPVAVPEDGFVWLAFERDSFAQDIAQAQAWLAQWAGMPLLDLHVSDLLNTQLPSHFDYTSVYDMLVIRKLADGDASTTGQLPTTRKVQTMPIGLVAYDRVLLSVHPAGCGILAAYVKRLKQLANAESGHLPAASVGATVGTARLPDSPAELMLRVVSLAIDGYLDLRKVMTRQLDHWQQRLLRPNVRFDNWEGLLKARQALHHLYDICDDQRNAMDRWMDVLEDRPAPQTPSAQHEHDQLLVRSRDVLEHIERVSHHVQQLEQSAETAVQIHFNIQSNRTNDVMRTLTAVTAVFLPLNLIAGIFGMNFEYIPWLHQADGFWWAVAAMVFIAVVLFAYLGRKRYLTSSPVE